ncbi:MAG: tripartite tricarboxylate transporter substrate-binding protein [Bradyrhizobium sp.]
MGTNTTHAGNVAMLKNLPYDPVKDFAPVMRTVTTAMVLLVKPDFPAKDVTQFLDYAKTHPNLTAGYGSGASQISVGQLQSRGRPVGDRGVLPRCAAGGHRRDDRAINLTFADLLLAVPQMQGGTLRGIGVTSAKRSELIPALPALAEAIPGFEATIWYGLLAPANTSSAVVDKLYAESEKFLTMPATKEKLANVGVTVSTMPPKEFGAFIQSEIVRWTADAKAAGNRTPIN